MGGIVTFAVSVIRGRISSGRLPRHFDSSGARLVRCESFARSKILRGRRTEDVVIMGTLTIEVGGIYANAKEFLAREVLSIRDGIVEYRDFALEDGQPFSPCSRCSLYHFQRWSARPVTAEEASRLRR